MTKIFFVRHAQPDAGWEDDRTRPLTALGKKDRAEVTGILKDLEIDLFFSSPYQRSLDTILLCAEQYGMKIHTDERFRERGQGIRSTDFLEKRWADFTFCEEKGENLASVQKRNTEALAEIIGNYPDKKIVIGTHGTALSTVIHYYDPSFNCDSFKRIWFSMPYILQMDFDGVSMVTMKELLKIDRGY